MSYLWLNKKPLLSRLYHLLWIAVDWLYPPHCAGCNIPDETFCPDCQLETIISEPHLCERCGNPKPETEICIQCVENPPAYLALRSWGKFAGPLQKAIHRLKYQNDIGLGETFARIMSEMLLTFDWDIDLVIPVPLNRIRMRDRGYNQSAMIAYPLALILQVPYSSRALIRIKNTPSQVNLSAKERKINVHDAFKANKDIVQGNSILLIDDVTTTGATIEACALELMQKEAKKVYGFTLSRSILKSQNSVR